MEQLHSGICELGQFQAYHIDNAWRPFAVLPTVTNFRNKSREKYGKNNHGHCKTVVNTWENNMDW